VKLAWALVLLTACRVDVSIGRVDGGPEDAEPIDLGFGDAGLEDVAPLDAIIADSGIHPTASRLVVLTTAEVTCIEGWAGREGEFQDVTPTPLGLANGPIEVELVAGTSSMAEARGQALLDSFGFFSIPLTPPPPDVEAPAGIYGNSFFLSGPGPLGTERRAGMIMFDLSGAQPINGFIGVELADPASHVDSCFVQFATVISPT
jgi:hypothetical protein